MLRLCFLIIVGITVSSCCRPIIVADVRYEIMKASPLVDDDTIVPPPPARGFLVFQVEPVLEDEPKFMDYPLLALAKRIECSMILQAFVDKYGFVRRANVVKCTHPGYGFEESAIAAAYNSKWKPAVANGNPIGTWVEYKVGFELKK